MKHRKRVASLSGSSVLVSYRMDIYPRYPKRIALNGISAAVPIPVDNMRLRECLMVGGELKRLDPVFASRCGRPQSMLRSLC